MRSNVLWRYREQLQTAVHFPCGRLQTQTAGYSISLSSNHRASVHGVTGNLRAVLANASYSVMGRRRALLTTTCSVTGNRRALLTNAC